MTQTQFFWQTDDSASIAAGNARLWLVATTDNPVRWAVYEGYKLLGITHRTEDDRTPDGEAKLWARIEALLATRGLNVDNWGTP